MILSFFLSFLLSFFLFHYRPPPFLGGCISASGCASPAAGPAAHTMDFVDPHFHAWDVTNAAVGHDAAILGPPAAQYPQYLPAVSSTAAALCGGRQWGQKGVLWRGRGGTAGCAGCAGLRGGRVSPWSRGSVRGCAAGACGMACGATGAACAGGWREKLLVARRGLHCARPRPTS